MSEDLRPVEIIQIKAEERDYWFRLETPLKEELEQVFHGPFCIASRMPASGLRRSQTIPDEIPARKKPDHF